MGRISIYKIQLVACLFIMLLAVGLSWWLPLSQAYSGVRYGGYAFSFVIVSIWLISAYPVIRAEWRPIGTERKHWLCLLILLGVGLVCLLRQPAQFQVLSDELTLQSTALAMSSEREVFSASQGYWLSGTFELTSGTLDKRPFMFPFVVSLVHDFFGYRLSNAFALNLGLGLTSLWIGFLLINRWFVSPVIALLAMLPIACSPMFISSVRSAGFEPMNFCFLGLYGLAVSCYWRKDDAQSEVFLVSTAVLLSYIRYESCLLVLPAACLIGYRCFQKEGALQSRLTVIAPLLFVPFVWLFRCTLARKGAWPVAEAEGISVFSTEYVRGNLLDAMKYFYDPSWSQMNDFAFSVLGSLGVILILVNCGIRAKPSGHTMGESFRFKYLQEVSFWVACFVLLLLVYSGYFWSSFLDISSRRMSLPFLWPLSLGLAYGLSRFYVRWKSADIIASFLVAICLLFSTLPSMARMAESREPNRLAKLQTWKMYWAAHAGIQANSAWFVDDDYKIWTARRSTAFSSKRMQTSLALLELHWRAERIADLYVVQIKTRGKAGKWQVIRGAIPSGVILQDSPVAEYYLDSTFLCQIFKVADIQVADSKFDQFWSELRGFKSEPRVKAAFDAYLWQHLP